ncbi:hypothetical protein K491DRAFT_677491 [Lophiostoma macrostomum CBS 122681]|uniref:Uncharacterized protein n=1 Tax=Lophiostoma macrostomum CBS 122681 TaxID=1314788 RepID=A0A6A6TCV5_9PLEO|nr:hypothetical protein K491DRAFT_677491 [Lophiostoma macrostomum CBS 122681]
MHALVRSAPSALRTWSGHASRRAFSNSCAHQRGSLPQFLPASTPELSALLSTLNSKILLPEHLTPDQHKLVFRKENKAKLEAEPIEITLGNVTLPLEHLDKTRDLPPRVPTIFKIIDSSTTPDDYENVVRMIEGLRSAGITLDIRKKEKIVRVLSAADQQHLVLRALQRASATDMRLRNQDLVACAFKGLFSRARRSGWDEAETRKMLGFAEQYVDLMEDEEHLGKSDMKSGDLRSSPLVICYPLALAAVRAKKHTGAQDVDGKVRLYAGRLMEALRQRDFLINELPVEAYSKVVGRKRNVEHSMQNQYIGRVQQLARLWTALHVSRDVLGSDMPHPEYADKVESAVQAVWQQAKQTEGLDRFTQILNNIGEEMGEL